MAGAIAPATVSRRSLARRGPKAPGQRPPRPRRALLARRVGRWPLLFPDLPIYGEPSRAGGGNAVRFLIPPGSGEQSECEPPAPLPWQGPSPLPQRPADPWPAGGPKPPASARPAPGGRFSPAGSGAGLCRCGWHGSWWQRSARAGKRSAFPVPARTDKSTFTPADPTPAGGPKPPASARPTPGGRWPLSLAGPADQELTHPARCSRSGFRQGMCRGLTALTAGLTPAPRKTAAASLPVRRP
jgi:hypothetical protein